MESNLLEFLKTKKKVMKLSAVAFIGAMATFCVSHGAHAMLSNGGDQAGKAAVGQSRSDSLSQRGNDGAANAEQREDRTDLPSADTTTNADQPQTGDIPAARLQMQDIPIILIPI